MKLDQAFLEAALVGYLQQRDQMDAKILEIQKQLGGSTTTSQRSREMSAAARERIAAAQRKRWAAFHKSTPATAAKKAPAKKRQLSPAARKRIADATRKRWAAYRAQKAAQA